MKKNSTFIVSTETDNKYEVCPGLYVVNAKVKKDAQAAVEELMGDDETVTGVVSVDMRKRGVVDYQEAMIE
jgi:hypothetical protein